MDRLERRLSAYRQQMSLHILWGMRYDSALAYGSIYANKSSRKQLECGLDNLAQEQKRTRQEIVQLVGQRRDWKEGLIAAIAAAPLPETTPGGFEESHCRFAKLICHQLHFDRISNREERIPDVHKATFEWIFKPPTAEQLTWADFGEWLEGDSSIYWITGKAGAGKSTLMKFIGHDTRTTRMLRKSAGDRRLVIARFYFWNSGVELQMTQEGLLRTLTHDVLQQFNDLAAKAFPHRWELFQLFGIFDPEPIDYLGLRRRLVQIIKADPSTQFVFFIDGLDEFIGDRSDLAAYAKQLSDSTNAKVCVSSRPWNEFEDAFASAPSLRVEDLTYPHIVCFIESKFNESPGYAELRAEDEAEAESILHAIASKASGVFLWVSLVVKSLLSGLTNGERLSKLRNRLDSLPPDLENLFQRMLDQINHEDREDASKLFQIVRAALETPTIMTLAWADGDDPNLPFTRAVKPLSAIEKDARSRRMCRRLNSHCRGLLQANRSSSSEATVEFVHRMVRDFLYGDEVWSTLQSYTPTSFHPYRALCQSYLLWMKCANEFSRLTHGSIFGSLRRGEESHVCKLLLKFMLYAQKLYRMTGDPQLQLYNELARSAKDIFGPNGPCVSSTGSCWCQGPVDHDDGPFLSLAIALRITPYICDRLTGLPTRKANSKEGLSVLQVAVLSDDLRMHEFWREALLSYEEERFHVIKLLLTCGADPNLSTDPLKPSAWAELIQRGYRQQPDIYMEFLRHGADPWLDFGSVCTKSSSWKHVLVLQRKMRMTERLRKYTTHLRRLRFWS